jgi:hypothetical protein
MDLTNFACLQKFQKTKKMEEELWAGSENGSATCNASGPDLVGVGKQRAARGVIQRRTNLG